MNLEIRAKLAALGTALSPPMLQGTTALMASLAAPRDASVEVKRDQRYGSDERHRLDIFRKGRPAKVPVLAYVHGGGFVMGDKTRPDSPFFDNFGQWAAQRGWIGVTITYRLAPAHRWPSGPEDMSLAVRWLRGHIAEYGGNPEAIFLVGQSAGGAHVAAYVAQTKFHVAPGTGLAGAVMTSGIYDAMTQPANQFSDAYYGEGTAARAEARHVEALAGSGLPLLFSVSELDPEDFQDQAMQLAKAWHERKGRYAPMEYLAGHNHLSPAQSIGSAEDQFATRLANFVAVNSP